MFYPLLIDPTHQHIGKCHSPLASSFIDLIFNPLPPFVESFIGAGGCIIKPERPQICSLGVTSSSNGQAKGGNYNPAACTGGVGVTFARYRSGVGSSWCKHDGVLQSKKRFIFASCTLPR